jgi:predicted PurR-regulated permease PerM
LRGPSDVPLQAAGMLVFGAGMLVALYVEPVLGGTLVAIGLLGHAAWDAVHFVRNRVVTRPYAEFCAVLDLLVGAAVLFVLFVR